LERWYCIAQTNWFCSDLQRYEFIRSTWVEQINISIIFVCENCFLYILLIFVLLHHSASSHTILTRLLALTSTVYKFLKIGIIVGPTLHIEKITIGNTRDNHHPTTYYVNDVHRKMGRNPAIDAVIYAIESNDTGPCHWTC